MPLVAFRIVDALRCRTAFRISWKVVIVDLLRLLTPRLARVFELTKQFLLLRVHADSGITTATEILAALVDVLELLIALRMRLAGVQHFAVATQSLLLVTQQTADGRWTGALVQLLRQRTQARAHPFLVRTWIAGRFGIDATLQSNDQSRIFFSTRGRPPPASRTRWAGRWRNSSSRSSRPRRMVSG